jgi:hypothetical protein
MRCIDWSSLSIWQRRLSFQQFINKYCSQKLRFTTVNKYCTLALHMWDALTICCLMDVNSTKVQVPHWTLTQSIVWIVQHPWVIHEILEQFSNCSRIAPKFRSLTFRTTVKADLSNAVDKGALLQEHISNCMHSKGHFMSHRSLARYWRFRFDWAPLICPDK